MNSYHFLEYPNTHLAGRLLEGLAEKVICEVERVVLVPSDMSLDEIRNARGVVQFLHDEIGLQITFVWICEFFYMSRVILRFMSTDFERLLAE